MQKTTNQIKPMKGYPKKNYQFIKKNPEGKQNYNLKQKLNEKQTKKFKKSSQNG